MLISRMHITHTPLLARRRRREPRFHLLFSPVREIRATTDKIHMYDIAHYAAFAAITRALFTFAYSN